MICDLVYRFSSSIAINICFALYCHVFVPVSMKISLASCMVIVLPPCVISPFTTIAFAARTTAL